jgi:hypothetical protein
VAGAWFYLAYSAKAGGSAVPPTPTKAVMRCWNTSPLEEEEVKACPMYVCGQLRAGQSEYQLSALFCHSQ